jgi:hypothetical protein
MPTGKQSARAVLFETAGEDFSVDDDGLFEDTNIVARERRDAFDERHAERQIAALGGELGDPFRRADEDEIAAPRVARNDAIKADGRARRDVPHESRRRVDEGRKADQGKANSGGGKDGHGALSHRSSPSSEAAFFRSPSDQASRSSM